MYRDCIASCTLTGGPQWTPLPGPGLEEPPSGQSHNLLKIIIINRLNNTLIPMYMNTIGTLAINIMSASSSYFVPTVPMRARYPVWNTHLVHGITVPYSPLYFGL